MAVFSLNHLSTTKNVLLNGDAPTLSFTLKNTDPQKRSIRSLSLNLQVNSLVNGTRVNLPAGVRCVLPDSGLDYGATAAFTAQITVDTGQTGSGGVSLAQFFAQNSAVRSLPLQLTVTANTGDSVSVSMFEFATLVNGLCMPEVAAFELCRTIGGVEHDEGEELMASVKLSLGAPSEHMQAMLYYCAGSSLNLPLRYSYPEHPACTASWLGCEISASSTYADSSLPAESYAPWKVFASDGAWRSSANASGPWIQLKLPRALYGVNVTIVNAESGSDTARGITDGLVYGVNADGGLVEIGSFSGRDGAGFLAETTVECSNADTAFDTLRIKVTAWYGGSFAAVGKIRISGWDLPVENMPECLVLSEHISDMLAGVSNSSDLVPLKLSNSSDWCAMLWFGDEFESAQAKCLLSRAFANVHLSGRSTGGVCFGGFGTSRLNRPRLESYYPASFYAGIDKIGSGWTELTPIRGTTPAAYGGGVLRCRRIENRCIIAGSLLVKPGSDTVVLAQLPDGFAPVSGVFSLNACSGARIARIVVGGVDEENAGKLALSWVRNLSDGGLYTGDAIWVQCSIEYWVDEPEEDTSETALLGRAILGRMILGRE